MSMIPKTVCNDDSLSKEQRWRNIYGTDNYGNLPEDKKNLEHVGNCFAVCPYDTRCSPERTRAMLKIAKEDPLPAQSLHVIDLVEYFMEADCRGSVWGYTCQNPECAFKLANDGISYFYK